MNCFRAFAFLALAGAAWCQPGSSFAQASSSMPVLNMPAAEAFHRPKQGHEAGGQDRYTNLPVTAMTSRRPSPDAPSSGGAPLNAAPNGKEAMPANTSSQPSGTSPVALAANEIVEGESRRRPTGEERTPWFLSSSPWSFSDRRGPGHRAVMPRSGSPFMRPAGHAHAFGFSHR